MMSSTSGSATSPGWETVVSSKSVKASSHKNKQSAANAAKRKFAERAPKLEDVLPMDQVNAIYNAEPGLREANKVVAPSSPAKSQKTANKKPKKVAPKAPAKPKTLEVAVKQFGVNEFKAGLIQTKTFYHNNHAMWIKEAAVCLNECLVSEEPCADFSQHFATQPMSQITKEMKKTIVQLLEECGDGGRSAGYESLVVNLGHELAKSPQSEITGNLIVLQIMAESYPHLAMLPNKRFGELIHSYQNRAGVCIPILWALGQSGRKDLSVGLKVWIEYMRPLLRLKNYTRHVVSYLIKLLDHHQATTVQGRILYPPQFFAILDTVFLESQGLNKDIQKDLTSVFPAVKGLSIGDCSIDHELFPEFLRRISDWFLLENKSESYRSILTDCIVECLCNNPLAVISHWQQMYRSHFSASAFVLQQIGSKAYSSKLQHSRQLKHHSESFEELIEAFQEYNATCSSQKEGIGAANEGCKNLVNVIRKMESGSGSGLPYKTMILLLAIGLGSVINYDVGRKGSFQKSNTGIFLQDIGMYESTVNAYDYSVETYAFGKAWAEENLPVYYNKTRENVGPLIQEANVQLKWALEEAKKAGPMVVTKVNEYLPGAKEKTMLFLDEASKQSNIAFEWVLVNGKVLLENVSVFAQNTAKSTQATVQDIIDGKIELKDVYNGMLDMGDKAVQKVNELRKNFAT